jgi:hypothetical protein
MDPATMHGIIASHLDSYTLIYFEKEHNCFYMLFYHLGD